MKTVMRLTLEGEMLDRFNFLKEHYGVTNSTNIVRMLISEKYDKLEQKKTRKVWIAGSTYALLETKAKEKGLTVDEYLARLFENLFINKLCKELETKE